MLRERGIAPVAVAGHSVGEVAAAWASGALTLEAAVEVIYQRSRLQGTTKGKGEMSAVGLGHGAAEGRQQCEARRTCPKTIRPQKLLPAHAVHSTPVAATVRNAPGARVSRLPRIGLDQHPR